MSDQRQTEPYIATHDGFFHCDEAMAIALLRLVPEFQNFKIARSRDPSIISKATIVVDVGGVYDPSTNRFDHHQRGFNEVFNTETSPKIKLSSAGLVYKHYGRFIIRQLYPAFPAFQSVELSDSDIDLIWNKCYSFFKHIDGNDNGIPAYENVAAAGECLYQVETSLPSIIFRLNQNWTCELTGEEKSEDENKRFESAVTLCNRLFIEYLANTLNVWFSARKIVCDAFDAPSIHPSIIEIPDRCPLVDLEEHEARTGRRILFKLSKDSAGLWRAFSISEPAGAQFNSRLLLPEPFRGLRDEELRQVSGIQSAVFVHANGFTGGCKIKEDMLEMMMRCIPAIATPLTPQ